MMDFTFKTLKTSFWILLPLFLISNTKAEHEINLSGNIEGTYELKVTGALEEQFKGVVYFETKVGSNNRGIPMSTLILRLGNKDSSYQHSMEFFISKKNHSGSISTGLYEVPEYIEGFLNNFDGVFGFANVKALGEEPLFARKGKIVITSRTDKRVEGDMNMAFRDINGKKMYVRGNFSAFKKDF